MSKWSVIQGGCGCGFTRYQLNREPIFTHCCNCHDCQRETNSAFVIHSLLEAEEVALFLGGSAAPDTALKHIIMPSESGKGQAIARCPRCYVAVWSYYSEDGPHLKFLKTATLDKAAVDGSNVEELVRPGAFIYNRSKQPWMEFPKYAYAESRVFDVFYNEQKMYTKFAYEERLTKVRERGRQWRENGGNWSDLGDITDVRQS